MFRNFKISFNKEILIGIVFSLLLPLVLFIYLQLFGKLASKFTIYLFIAPFGLYLLFKFKDPALRVLLPIFTLIFVENIILSRVPISDFIKVGVSFIAAIVVLLSSIFFNKEVKKLPINLTLILIIFLITAIISVIIGSNGFQKFLFAANIESFLTYYIEFFLFFFLAYISFNKPEQIDKFIHLLLLLATLSALGHIFSMLTGINLESIRGSEMVRAGRSLEEGNWRYGGFFGNVNFMSAFYVMIIPVFFVQSFNSRNVLIKLFALFSIATMILSTLMGASRGGLLFLAVNLFFALFFLQLNIKKIFYTLITTIFIVIIINQIFDQIFVDYVERAIEEMTRKGTESPRELIWEYTVDINKDYPFGVGLTEFNYLTLLQVYGNISWAHPHNMYLEILSQNGIIGIITFLFLFFLIIKGNIIAYLNCDDNSSKELFAYLTLIILGFLLMGIVNSLFSNQFKLNHIIAVILGISVNLQSFYKHQNSTTELSNSN